MPVQARPADPDLMSEILARPALWVGVGGLLLLLLGGAAVLLWFQRWQRRLASGAVIDPAELREQYRAMRDAGELSPEEYDRILGRLDGPAEPPAGTG